MLVSDNKHYLYRHIRLDTNEVFYIGIGKALSYYRSKSKQYRNPHWNRIVEKAGYRIQIVLDYLTKEEAEIKEKEFIEIYGRADKNKGTLVNMTDGGYGVCGHIKSKETRKKFSVSMTGRPSAKKGMPVSEDTRARMSAGSKGHKRWAGKHHTEESKVKIGLASTGRVGYWGGKTMSEDSKEKISIANSGKKKSKEFSENMSKRVSGNGNPMFGRKHSEETKRKISETKLRKSC